MEQNKEKSCSSCKFFVKAKYREDYLGREYECYRLLGDGDLVFRVDDPYQFVEAVYPKLDFCCKFWKRKEIVA